MLVAEQMTSMVSKILKRPPKFPARGVPTLLPVIQSNINRRVAVKGLGDVIKFPNQLTLR